ncbi:hypothetical protein F4803DRAFT_536564 [Xylaria telfairii]|nr:hypothetical protein F4803DRAFT_536564 [Xylaria telfairii]
MIFGYPHSIIPCLRLYFVSYCIQMLKCWYGSLQDWRFWHPKLESIIPPVIHRTGFPT